MHLKNFSMWLSNKNWIFSSAYDLLNVKLVLPKDKDDMALLFGGKKANFNKSYFDRFGLVLKLNEKQINAVYKRLGKWLPNATQLIEISFLTDDYKSAYTELITHRVKLFTS